MTQLKAGDRVVCINDAPVAVEDASGRRQNYACGLLRGGAYTVSLVKGGLVYLKEATNPLGLMGGQGGYTPGRFRLSREALNDNAPVFVICDEVGG